MLLAFFYVAMVVPLVTAIVSRRRFVAGMRQDTFGRVHMGAARLDRATPDWAMLVDVDRLDLVDLHQCVLGQVYGSYGNGLRALGITGMGTAHGFVSLGASDAVRLKSLWRQEIAERRRDYHRVAAAEARERARREAQRQWAQILAVVDGWEQGFNDRGSDDNNERDRSLVSV